MTQDEINRAAEAIILAHNDEYDFGMVYEDQKAIYDAMYTAKITITFD